MKLLCFIMIAGMTFSAYGMKGGDLVTKEKDNKTIDGTEYAIKTFKQARTTHEHPVLFVVSRSKNKKTEEVSFSGEINILVLNESRFEYVTSPDKTTYLTHGKNSESQWEALKANFKASK